MRERLNVVFTGHVDHGKSTLIGRLLADTGSLPEGKIEQVRRICENNSKPFEYAFLLDAFKDEQSQGITIDSARVFFKTDKRYYIIIDAPGHVEFLKNMVSGASRAEAAVLVIDACEGVRENTKRHGYLISMLGIRQLAVVVNKMDLVGYSEERFRAITSEYSGFLEEIGIKPSVLVPASGMMGENISKRSDRMAWYKGATLLEALDSFNKEPSPTDMPFRMPVQDVYKFTQFGDDRRIVAGTPEGGRIEPGDGVIFYPSGKKNRVKTVEDSTGSGSKACEAGIASGFTLEEEIYVTRGEVAARESEKKPEISSRFKVRLFWMGKNSLEPIKSYRLKIGTAKVTAWVESISLVIDASSLNVDRSKDRVDRHEVAECIIRTNKPIVFDAPGRSVFAGTTFVLVDDHEIAGGGAILGSAEDAGEELQELVDMRELKWIKSSISPESRAKRHNQKPFLVVVTGASGAPRKEIARYLEEKLYTEGFDAYFLAFGSVLYGVDADLKKKESLPGVIDEAPEDASVYELSHIHWEHMRRLGEIANILLNSGLILIVTAVALTEEDVSILKTSLKPYSIMSVCVGETTTDLNCDIKLSSDKSVSDPVNRLMKELSDRGIIKER